MFETKNAELAGPFLYPVEEIIAALPDYTSVIKTPIDLNHIKARINEGEYDDAPQLNSDFRLMCQNAMRFNPPSHDVHIAAQKFLKLWDEKYKSLPPKEVPVSRSYSEDPVADDAGDVEEDDFEDGELNPSVVITDRADPQTQRSKCSASRLQPWNLKSSRSNPNAESCNHLDHQRKPSLLTPLESSPCRMQRLRQA